MEPECGMVVVFQKEDLLAPCFFFSFLFLSVDELIFPCRIGGTSMEQALRYSAPLL